MQEQYIEDDSLSAIFYYDLNAFTKDSRLVIEKELVNNRHVDNLVDTILNLKFDKIYIRKYKATDEEWIYEAKIQNPNFQLSRGVKIGISGKEFESILNTKINVDKVKVGNLEQTSVFIFNFKKGRLEEIVYEGYLD